MSLHRPLNWTNIAFMTLSPVVAFIGIGCSLSAQGVQPEDLAIFLGMLCGTGLALTAGYHRYYSHRSYECHPLVQLFSLLFGAAAFQNSALCWASNHRAHHRFVDQEGDPHNITTGILWAHIGWMFYRDRSDRSFDNVPDLQADRLVMWQHRSYLPLGVGIGFGLPFLIGLACGRPWGGFLWGGLLRVVLVHHCTFLVNSAGHTIGPQPYSTKDSSRDNWWLTLLIFGDGYHNFHHTFPGDYRGGPAWYHWDPAKWWIWSLSFLGLTWRCNRTPQQLLAKAQAKTTAAEDEFVPDWQPEER